MAPGVWLMPLRVNLMSGKNQNRADAINYVAAQARRFRRSRRYVINCSWKMSGNHAGVRHAIRNAVNSNVVVCFAAGNDGRDIDVRPQYPAVYPEVIAVAATDQRDRRASLLQLREEGPTWPRRASTPIRPFRTTRMAS